MPRLYRRLSPELYTEAVFDWAAGKWARTDVLGFIEEFVGIDRAVFRAETLDGDNGLKVEVVDSIAAQLSDIIDDILAGRDLGDLIGPVSIDARIDRQNGKTREIATLDIWHQLLGHIAKVALDPLFSARIMPTQHASIPGRGQTGLKKQAQRYLRKDIGIRCVQKTDVHAAYASLKYETVIGLIEKEIPRAKDLLKLLRFLGTLAPGGHLIIGGYLDAWLFNYAMSYAIRYAYTLGHERRGKFIPYVARIEAYMDDFGIMAYTPSGLQKAVKKLGKWFRDNLGLDIKLSTGVIMLESEEAERERSHETTMTRRACPCLDMGGFRIHRTYITMRERVFKRARRQWLRATAELKRTGTIPLFRAYKIVAYNGFLQQTDSDGARRKYKTRKLLQISKRVIAYHSRTADRARREQVYDRYRRYELYKTGLCKAGETA